MRRHLVSRVLPGFAIIGRAQFRSKRLRALPASYALTGSDATLRLGTLLILEAGAGAFALTGQTGSLLVGRRVAADAASFAFSGQDATLQKRKTLVAEVASFAISGQDTALKVARRVVAEAASFAITGTAATMRKGLNLAAGVANYAVTGQAATLRVSRKLAAAAASFAFSGQAASLLVSKKVVAAAASYAFTGQSATLSIASSFSNARSLDFESGSSQYLSRSWGAGGTSRRLMTWSFFYKRESTGLMRLFVGGENTGDNEFFIQFDSAHHLNVATNIGAVANVVNKVSTATFTDTASWHHIVVALDTTQATADNRCRVYHDGTEITSWGTNTNFALNADCPVNGYNTTYTIGRLNYAAFSYFDGLLDEFIFVDGQQLAPSDFAASATAPKAYSGTYGAKGFRLRFEDTGSLGADDSGNGNNWTLVNTPVTSTDHP